MKNLKKLFFATSILLALVSNLSYASGLMVTPSRIELQGDTKSAEVKLINKGNETTTYRIAFKHLAMTQGGTYEEIKNGSEIPATEKFADELVVYSPKQVTLKPGEIQTIRLMVKKPTNLESGEYRSHLFINEEAPADFGNDVEEKSKNNKKISVILKPLFAISIPVIVKHGDLTGNISISKLEIKKADEKNNNKKSLFVTLSRTGNSGIYGDIIATFTPKGSTTKYDIGAMGNIAVFYPYENRDLSIALNIPQNIKLSNGVVEAKFYDKKDDGSNRKLLAQKSINIE